MSKEKETSWKELFSEVKDMVYDESNIKKITLTSIIIGGGFQVIYLSLISPFYLRFFSVSQMVSDSLMILIIYLFITIIHGFSEIISNIKKVDDEKDIDTKLFKISFFIFGIILTTFEYKRVIEILQNIPHPSSLSEIIWAGIIIYFYWLLLQNICSWFNISLRDIKDKKLKKDLNTVKFILFILFGIWLFQSTHNILIIPPHFMNLENICDTKKAEDTCIVKYFNDKYIFIEKGDGKIELKEFNNFFN